MHPHCMKGFNIWWVWWWLWVCILWWSTHLSRHERGKELCPVARLSSLVENSQHTLYILMLKKKSGTMKSPYLIIYLKWPKASWRKIKPQNLLNTNKKFPQKRRCQGSNKSCNSVQKMKTLAFCLSKVGSNCDSPYNAHKWYMSTH